MQLRTYKFSIKHDKGTVRLTAVSNSEGTARKLISNMERCPPEALKFISSRNLPRQKMTSSRRKINYLETFYEMSIRINESAEISGTAAYELSYRQGSTALYDLTKLFTDGFEKMYKDVFWDGEWLEAIDTFYEQENKRQIEQYIN